MRDCNRFQPQGLQGPIAMLNGSVDSAGAHQD
jgi:hypothetical protein